MFLVIICVEQFPRLDHLSTFLSASKSACLF
uniref:Uncharacterized protein n=1 Tax=Triticum urartu TaxID=4572 RepID=A0A8R7PT68_TRIUA